MKKFMLMSAFCALIFAGCKDDSEPEIPMDADYTGLVLNEICGGGEDKDDDWVEIYNTSGASISLNGVKLVKTDENGVSEILCTFAEGTAVGSKSYIVKSKQNSDFTQGISNSKQVTVTLQAPSGKEIDKFDKSTEFGAEGKHEIGGGYSRIPDGTGEWTVVLEATKGTANKVTEPEEPSGADYTGLVLNELNGNDPKYIELYNYSDKELDITGVKIKKDDESIVYVAPEGTKISAHGFLVLLSDQPAGDYTNGFTSGLSAKKSVKIELLSSDGVTSLDVFKNQKSDGSDVWGDKSPKYNGESEAMAYGRKVDGTGEWYMMKATQGAGNATTAELGTKIEW